MDCKESNPIFVLTYEAYYKLNAFLLSRICMAENMQKKVQITAAGGVYLNLE